VKTKSPAELAQINSLSDLPVPSGIKNLLSPSEKTKMKAEEKKRRYFLRFFTVFYGFLRFFSDCSIKFNRICLVG